MYMSATAIGNTKYFMPIPICDQKNSEVFDSGTLKLVQSIITHPQTMAAV